MPMKIPAPPKLPKEALSRLSLPKVELSKLALPKVTLPAKLPALPLLPKLTNLPNLPERARLTNLPKLPVVIATPVNSPAPHDLFGATSKPSPTTAMWRTFTKPFRLVNWRILAAALFGMGMLHIIATLAAPSLALSTAFNRLEGILPANRMVVLPQISPQAQPLPFMSPALRYAMCRYDTHTGPIDVSVELNDTGSSLTIYSVDGEAVYTAAQSDVALHRVRIIPTDGRFLGLTPEARGRQSTQVPSATLLSERGVIVYATPDLGASYQSATERQLTATSCQPSTTQ